MAAATADDVIARRRRPARRQCLVIMKAPRDATAAIVAVAPALSSLVLGMRMLAARAAGSVTDKGGGGEVDEPRGGVDEVGCTAMGLPKQVMCLGTKLMKINIKLYNYFSFYYSRRPLPPGLDFMSEPRAAFESSFLTAAPSGLGNAWSRAKSEPGGGGGECNWRVTGE